MILPILTWPHSALTTPTELVTPDELKTPEFDRQIQDMAETLKHHKAYGLAANQVGWNKRVLVFVQRDKEGELGIAVLVNPEIVSVDERMIRDREGCLSFPGHFDFLDAPISVTVRHIKQDGTIEEDTCYGYEARCVYHEIQHLEGHTFVERMRPLQKRMFLKAYRKRRVDAR